MVIVVTVELWSYSNKALTSHMSTAVKITTVEPVFSNRPSRLQQSGRKWWRRDHWRQIISYIQSKFWVRFGGRWDLLVAHLLYPPNWSFVRKTSVKQEQNLLVCFKKSNDLSALRHGHLVRLRAKLTFGQMYLPRTRIRVRLTFGQMYPPRMRLQVRLTFC